MKQLTFLKHLKFHVTMMEKWECPSPLWTNTIQNNLKL